MHLYHSQRTVSKSPEGLPEALPGYDGTERDIRWSSATWSSDCGERMARTSRGHGALDGRGRGPCHEVVCAPSVGVDPASGPGGDEPTRAPTRRGGVGRERPNVSHGVEPGLREVPCVGCPRSLDPRATAGPAPRSSGRTPRRASGPSRSGVVPCRRAERLPSVGRSGSACRTQARIRSGLGRTTGRSSDPAVCGARRSSQVRSRRTNKTSRQRALRPARGRGGLDRRSSRGRAPARSSSARGGAYAPASRRARR